MNIKIYNVGHGACAMVTFPNGRTLMLDCGRNNDPVWKPSIEFFGQRVDLLVMQNLDYDHMADLPDVVAHVNVRRYFSNPTVGANEFLAMKWRPGGMLEPFEVAYQAFEKFGPVWGPEFGIGDCWERVLFNLYGKPFTDPNNLSVPMLIGRGDFAILFGGDMERAGWENIVRIPGIADLLRRVKVYVASHHGRWNGRSDTLFKYLCPQVTIVSDCEIRHDTQEDIDWYADRSTGIRDLLTPRQSIFDPEPQRKVLTTRKDGGLHIEVDAVGNFVVVPERFWLPATANPLIGLPSLS